MFYAMHTQIYMPIFRLAREKDLSSDNENVSKRIQKIDSIVFRSGYKYNNSAYPNCSFWWSLSMFIPHMCFVYYGCSSTTIWNARAHIDLLVSIQTNTDNYWFKCAVCVCVCFFSLQLSIFVQFVVHQIRNVKIQINFWMMLPHKKTISTTIK